MGAVWEGRDPAASLRDNICRYWVSRLEALSAAPADPDRPPTAPDVVARSPLTAPDKLMGIAVAVLDTAERKKPEVGYERCVLALDVEFQARLALGDEGSAACNRLLLEVQLLFGSDLHSGNMALNLVEVGNEIDVDGPADRVVGGVVHFEVTYRHAVRDPRRLPGEQPT